MVNYRLNSSGIFRRKTYQNKYLGYLILIFLIDSLKDLLKISQEKSQRSTPRNSRKFYLGSFSNEKKLS